MMSNTPAAGSELEPAIDETLVDMTNVCNDCEHQGCLAQLKAGRKRILNLITAQNNATYEAVMEVIGDDEPMISSKNQADALMRTGRNQLRAELRKSIAKIYGRGE